MGYASTLQQCDKFNAPLIFFEPATCKICLGSNYPFSMWYFLKGYVCLIIGVLWTQAVPFMHLDVWGWYLTCMSVNGVTLVNDTHGFSCSSSTCLQSRYNVFSPQATALVVPCGRRAFKVCALQAALISYSVIMLWLYQPKQGRKDVLFLSPSFFPVSFPFLLVDCSPFSCSLSQLPLFSWHDGAGFFPNNSWCNLVVKQHSMGFYEFHQQGARVWNTAMSIPHKHHNHFVLKQHLTTPCLQGIIQQELYISACERSAHSFHNKVQ